MKCLLIAVPVAVFMAGPAAAANFAGPRAELHGGWDRPAIDGETADGLLFGAGVGYDTPIGERTMIGVEANVDFSTADIAVGGGELQVRRDIEGSLRLGYQVNDRTLLYGKAGYANARVRARAFGLSSSEDLDGGRLGVGTEFAYSDSGFVKIEYRYTNYQSGFERSQLLFAIGARF